jgi:hypothetical protein
MINRTPSAALALLAALCAVLLAACVPAAPEAPAEPDEAPDRPASEAEAETDAEPIAGELPATDLAAVKDYTAENGAGLEQHAGELAEQAGRYYDIIAGADFDYEAAWDANSEELAALVSEMRATWLSASEYYESAEGIVAGVPSLADYDLWLDAGPPASEAPDEAYEWTLELPNGETLDSPGNLFHTLLEPALYGTNPDFVGAEIDLDGDGEVTFTEVLPEANILYGSAQALERAAGEMNAAVAAWEPTVEDAFTALLVMTPTMNEYFEQWKQSATIAGEEAEEDAFIATSRLFDVTHILDGLNLTYDNLSVIVESADPALDEQIQTGYADLSGYVGALYEDEQAGKRFSGEEADALGVEAQDQAQSLSALVAQAAEEAGVELDLE